MSLTLGNAPFGTKEYGTFNVPLEHRDHILYLHPSPRRVRVEFGGEVVAESDHMKRLHESGQHPVYLFPREDVNMDLLEATEHRTPSETKGEARHWTVKAGGKEAENAAWSWESPPEGAPPLAGYVVFDWDAMDAWYEEDEQIHVHPRDPYHRVDVRDTHRHVRVSRDGEVLAETDRAKVLFETSLPPRYYIPPEDVRQDLLVHSDTHTGCPYKGTASYYSLKLGDKVLTDAVWYYPEPLEEAERVAGYLSFYPNKVDIEIADGGNGSGRRSG
ncbi:MAG TPA: DUF427 domain-containing protein [Longimicrobiales bacterium]|nr:DUF427 domain-containing protein [Longimicrobiales bacterium]